MMWTYLIACVDPGDSGGKAGTDSGTTSPVGPCDDGGFAGAADPGGAFVVSPFGDDAGDGSWRQPVATIGAGLALARAAGADQTLVIGPGPYAETVILQGDDGLGHSDDGLRVLGCGVDAVSWSPADTDSLTLQSTTVHDLVVSGVTFSGGRPALWLWSGTTATLDDLRVQGATRLGILVDGPDTLVTATDVAVTDTVAEVTNDEGYEAGYGVQVVEGGLVAERLSIAGSTTVGLFADGARLMLTEVDVTGTVANADGGLGRGIHAQTWSELVMSGGTLSDNADAGLFLMLSTPVTVTGVTVSATRAGVVPDESAGSGDGIVYSQGASPTLDPATFVAALSGNVVTGGARAGIVLDAVSATLDGNDTSGNTLDLGGASIVSQNGALTSGADPVTEASSGGALEPLELNLLSLAPELP